MLLAAAAESQRLPCTLSFKAALQLLLAFRHELLDAQADAQRLAHGGPSQEGALSHDERLRSQHWLTYERNELILASALRLAGEMERQLDTSRTTITKSNLSPSQENEVRTQRATIDGNATAARFLRLAYRINMDQHKLLQQQPRPDLEPLSIDDLNEQHLPALSEMEPSSPLVGCHGHPCPC